MTNSKPQWPLRPYLPADALALRDLFAASMEELTQDDYDEDQRAAWVSVAEDGEAFAAELGKVLTLVVELEGEPVGFASLKDNTQIAYLYVHPWHVGEGIGTALADALEKIATARGASAVSVDSTDTAQEFFKARGYLPMQRSVLTLDDELLSMITLKKTLKPVDTAPGGAKST
jgi:putative acetyltransferase